MASAPLSLSDPIYARVRERLREDILSGVYDAGDRLKIADLSQRYRVSQMPIREALQMLQGEGLITIEPNKGARVREIDESYVANSYDIRGALESMLTRLAIPRLKQSEIDVLRKLEASYEAALRRGDGAQCAEIDGRFHELIFECAGNPEALRWVTRQRGVVDCLRRKFGFGPARGTAIIREHQKLLGYLQRGEVREAEAAAREHCENAKLDLIAQMKRLPAATAAAV